jgi:predicted nucleotidyltransferase
MVEKRANPMERASSDVLRWPTPRSKDWTMSFIHSAVSNPNILAVIAVGSAVRPNVPSSDVDLLVICQNPNKMIEPPPLEVDWRAYPSADVDDRLAEGHDMLGWAVKFGRVLFQRRCFWDRVVESWRHRLPLPSSKLARARALTAHRRLTDLFQLGAADAAHEHALS